MGTVRELATISIMAGLGLAIILNAGKATQIINAVSGAWLGLIRTVSGTADGQVLPG